VVSAPPALARTWPLNLPERRYWLEARVAMGWLEGADITLDIEHDLDLDLDLDYESDLER
jgi:hypothetical protein